jgi:N-acetylneuraminic acid mutarotase
VGRTTAAALIAVAIAAGGCGGHSRAATTTGRTVARPRSTGLAVRRIGSLPQALGKAAAIALPHGRLMLLGGYAGGRSLDTILAGPPSRLRVVGRLPRPTHDAAAALLGSSVYLFGGGESVSTPDVVRIDPSTGSATEAPALDEPLSDLGAVTIRGRAYLVGGYTSTEFASAILRYVPHGGTATVARLPHGTRYAGVALLGRTIYVAGGLTTAGPTRSVYAVSLGGHVRRIATLPHREDHAALATLRDRLYLVGGTRVLAIDPASGKVSVAARLPASLSDPTATTVGKEIVVTGGGTNAVWSLSPAAPSTSGSR